MHLRRKRRKARHSSKKKTLPFASIRLCLNDWFSQIRKRGRIKDEKSSASVVYSHYQQNNHTASMFFNVFGKYWSELSITFHWWLTRNRCSIEQIIIEISAGLLSGHRFWPLIMLRWIKLIQIDKISGRIDFDLMRKILERLKGEEFRRIFFGFRSRVHCSLGRNSSRWFQIDMKPISVMDVISKWTEGSMLG